MCAKAVIGIPADQRFIDPHPFHAVGDKYARAIVDGAQALPFLLPALGDALPLDDVLDELDGVFLTGSPSNVEPHHYGGEPSRPGTWHDPDRDATTLPLIRKVLERDMPLFAVCRGFQELNVVLGGTLHQHVHEQPGYNMHKENPDDPLEVQYGPAHPVTLTDGGLLQQLAGKSSVIVNSLHGQGVATLAPGVTVEALAEDGLVEAFRIDNTGFGLAVQWHPEWKVTENPFSLAMFKAFGDAARAYAQKK